MPSEADNRNNSRKGQELGREAQRPQVRRFQWSWSLPFPLHPSLPPGRFCSLGPFIPPSLTQLVPQTIAHLLHGQLLQFGEGAGEQANQEGCGTADDVNHGGRKDRNEGVLPGEGVEQGHHSMGAAGECTGRQTETKHLSPGLAPLGNGS